MERHPSNAVRRQQPLTCGEAVLKGALRGYRGCRLERLMEHQGRWSG